VSTLPDVVTPVTAALVRGALELEPTDVGVRPHRLPAWARTREADAQLSLVEAQPAGVRLVFATTSSRLELTARASRFSYAGVPARPDGVFDLVVDGRLVAQRSLVAATTTTVDLTTGAARTETGEVESLVFDDLPAGPKTVEVWLPHTETVELAELRSDQQLTPVPPQGPVWVHHGSSISQGSNAGHPTGTWPVVAARAAGLELTNLGYGGSALLDPFVARTVRDTAADLISLEIGINLVNSDLMRLRAFGPAVHGFLDTIRDGHPDTPLLVISPLLCPIHEDTPGPGAFDLAALAEGRLRFRATGDQAEVNATATGKLTLRVIREQLAGIVAQRASTDPQLFGVDGLRLYGPQDAEELPLPDALHPDTATHQLIGQRVAAIAADLGWSVAG
jgi:lysophospholipase L1-like esterase